jgi:hypothetical protein
MLLVSIAAFRCDVTPSLLHPDAMGGLGPLGEMAQVVGITCLIMSGGGIVATVDHWKQGLVHRVGDLLLLAMVLPSAWILTCPLIVVHGKLESEHAAIREGADARSRKLFAELKSESLPEGGSGSLAATYREKVDEAEKLSLALKPPAYPLDLGSGLGLLVSWLAPLILYVSRRFYGLGIVTEKKEE